MSETELNFKNLLFNEQILKFESKPLDTNKIPVPIRFSESDLKSDSESDYKFGILNLTAIKTSQSKESHEFIFMVDCSGSMCGEPLNNALYITLLLHRLYNIGSAVLFSDTAERVYIEGETWYDSIQSLYCYPQGSTNLESIFSFLENNDNTTLVITDGDCDPMGQENNSPFQEALRHFPSRKFIVWNVKQSKLHFPYSVKDNRVGYISGNEPSVIDAVFKCLSNGELTPTSLLETCISEIEHPFVLDPVDKPFTNSQIQKLFFAVKKNIPNNNDNNDNDNNNDI